MFRAVKVCVSRPFVRLLHYSVAARTPYNQPIPGNKAPKFSGVATMMRLPYREGNAEGLGACFVGIPMDIGCSNRSGTRYGPQALRQESRLLKTVNITGAAPFESFNVADIGDVPINTFNLPKCMDIITEYYQRVVKTGCLPLTMGGDHTLAYPLLRAVAEKHGPVGLIQVDAHHDLQDLMFGEKIGHGTPFRRAIEDGIVSPHHMVQIGLRGGAGGLDDVIDNLKWGREQGIRMVHAEECWHRSLTPLIAEVREGMGDRPVYLTFDIDGIDPTHCPGTGTCEVGGLTPIQALEIVRGCRGLNLVGADLVEVNPLFDQSGATAVMGANLLFEMLCVLPGVKYFDFKLGKFDFTSL